MNIICPILLIITGFVLLVKGSDLLVSGASSLAKKLNVSELVIGLTIVAFGTSTPELIVNIFASLSKNNDIALGNIIGSNIINIILILGIAGLIHPLVVSKGTVWKEIPLTLISTILIYFLLNDNLFGKKENLLSRVDGLILLLAFLVFMIYLFKIYKKESLKKTVTIIQIPLKKIIAYIISGLLLLIGGGNILIENVVKITIYLGISEKIIAVTLVSLGTSMPELMTSVVAAYRKNSNIAVGNIIGSNIFNVFFILGISALISPIDYKSNFNFDILVLTIACLLLFTFMFTGKKKKIDRWEAFLFLIVYIVYNIFILKK